MVEKNNHRRRRSQVYSAELFLSHKLTHTFPWFFTIPFLIPILRPSYDQKCVLSLSSFIAPSLFTLSHSGSGPHCRAFFSLSLPVQSFPIFTQPQAGTTLTLSLSLSLVSRQPYLFIAIIFDLFNFFFIVIPAASVATLSHLFSLSLSFTIGKSPESWPIEINLLYLRAAPIGHFKCV